MGGVRSKMIAPNLMGLCRAGIDVLKYQHISDTLRKSFSGVIGRGSNFVNNHLSINHLGLIGNEINLTPTGGRSVKALHQLMDASFGQSSSILRALR